MFPLPKYPESNQYTCLVVDVGCCVCGDCVVGELDGDFVVGEREGCLVGSFVGYLVGCRVGVLVVGDLDGCLVGSFVGCKVGDNVPVIQRQPNAATLSHPV